MNKDKIKNFSVNGHDYICIFMDDIQLFTNITNKR